MRAGCRKRWSLFTARSHATPAVLRVSPSFRGRIPREVVPIGWPSASRIQICPGPQGLLRKCQSYFSSRWLMSARFWRHKSMMTCLSFWRSAGTTAYSGMIGNSDHSRHSNLRAAKFQKLRWPGTLQDLILKLARILRRVEELLDAQSGVFTEFTTLGFILQKRQDGCGHGVDVPRGNHESGDSVHDGIWHATVVRDNRWNPHGHCLEAGACKAFRKGGRTMDEDVDAVHDCANV